MQVLIRLIVCSILIVGMTSCVHVKSNISGTITRDGKPFIAETEQGHLLVLFLPEDRSKGSPVRAETDRYKGTYRIAEIPAGKYFVAIQQFDERHNDALGHRYDPVKTNLQYEVTDDDQVIDIDLPKDLPPAPKKN